jgi:hypothetical protein
VANIQRSTLEYKAIASGSADDGIRTRDLRFTKPLLYQLSYVGAARAKHCIHRCPIQALSCSSFAVRSA